MEMIMNLFKIGVFALLVSTISEATLGATLDCVTNDRQEFSFKLDKTRGSFSFSEKLRSGNYRIFYIEDLKRLDETTDYVVEFNKKYRATFSLKCNIGE